MLRTVFAFAVIVALAACETTNSEDWVGGEGTPFDQAERTCLTLIDDDIRQGADSRDFFVGCMRAFGWAPRPGASIGL